jgi:hypothetical protein
MLKQRPDLTPVCLLCLVVSKQKPANRLLIFVSRFVFAQCAVRLFETLCLLPPDKNITSNVALFVRPEGNK